jgi:hypothetical protein
MRCAFAYLCLFSFGSCSFASGSGSRQVPTPSEAYDQRVLEVVDRAASDVTDRFPSYIGASVHFSFRVDAIGRVSRLRVFAERASDRPIAQIVAQAIQAALFPLPPPQVLSEQGHRWFDVRERVFLVGAD